jgi:hypothetical protein
MADIEDKSQFFESRVLAPLTQLKHLRHGMAAGPGSECACAREIDR